MEQSPLPDRWSPVSPDTQSSLNAELTRDVCSKHPLFGVDAGIVAKLDGYDDFLFRLRGCDFLFAIVHLTWHEETSADFPWSTFFKSFDDFRENWKRIWD